MLLFLDESGTDHRMTPYEVLAGVAIQESNLWPLIQSIRTAEYNAFGMLLSSADIELKGDSFLKSKIFRFASQGEPIPYLQRKSLAQSFLEKSHNESHGQKAVYIRSEFTAFGQAALDFVRDMYSLCEKYNLKVFASIVSHTAPKTEDNVLRKDYSYLFQRFYYYLEELPSSEMGLLVFDERDKNFCKRLSQQMDAYFSQTGRGLERSTRIVPEPFFVHSDITTAVQIADVVAYSLNWGLRLNKMIEKTRPEIEEFAAKAANLQYIYNRDGKTNYGIKYIDDLRPRSLRNGS